MSTITFRTTEEDYRHTLASFQKSLKTVLGLRSVFVYGSYAIGEHILDFSDLDIGIIVSSTPSYKDLLVIRDLCGESNKRGVRVSPKIFTPAYLQTQHSFFRHLLAENSLDLVGENHRPILMHGITSKDNLLDSSLFKRLCERNRDFLLSKFPVINEYATSVKTVPVRINPHPLISSDELRLSRFLILVDKVLDTAMYGNGLRKTFKYRREEFASLFSENYKNEVDTGIVSIAFAFRSHFRTQNILDEYLDSEECSKRMYDFVVSFPDVVP